MSTLKEEEEEVEELEVHEKMASQYNGEGLKNVPIEKRTTALCIMVLNENRHNALKILKWVPTEIKSSSIWFDEGVWEYMIDCYNNN